MKKTITSTQVIAFLISLLFFSSTVLGQEKGTISGTITDQKTGEALPFVNVKIVELSTGVATDLDGKYTLEAPIGVYTLEISSVGYASHKVEAVNFEKTSVSQLNIPLQDATEKLNAVTVKASKVLRSEGAVTAIRKKAAGVVDAISAQEISKIGSSNAADALKGVPGASVVGGKYIYVRGLGDRYTNAQLNGQQLPSTDPYRNSTQLDMIPANLLDNIVASKSFTPDQPANFTGGNVNMKTKSFPDKLTVSFSTSLTYNTQSSFQDNFLTYEGGATDALGYDDGTRAIPQLLNDLVESGDPLNILDPSIVPSARRDEEIAQLVDDAAKSLNGDMSPTTGSSPLDYGTAFSIGNKKMIGSNPLGYIVGVQYKRGFSFYENGTSANYRLADRNAEGLSTSFDFDDTKSVDNPQLGGLVNLSYKVGGTNKFSLNALYNHDAEKITRYQVGSNPGAISGGDLFETRTLHFVERELQSYQMNNEHLLRSLNNAKVEWGLGFTKSSQDEPDLRLFANVYNPDESLYFITPAEHRLPTHFFRNLTDQQYLAKIDITLPFAQSKSSANQFKFGGLYTQKERSFFERRFQLNQNKGALYDGDAAAYFAQENMGVIAYDADRDKNIIGNYLVNNSLKSNIYTGQENVTGFYAMMTYDLRPLKITAGARAEITDMTVQSADENKPTGQIQQTDILPSINLTYALTEKMNFRSSFTQTLARPNMRELAPFVSFEFIGGYVYLGNPDLQRSKITNYDLRWEWFPRAGEVLALSGYYKNFDNPIIKAFIPKASNPEIQFQNVDNAKVLGIELEARKNLGFLSPLLNNFRLLTNVSLIHSVVDIPSDVLLQIQAQNPEFGDTRPFQGQSPFLVNAGLDYANDSLGLNASLSFNLFGDRLSAESQGGTPDIYEQGVSMLNFNLSKKIGNSFSIKVAAQNLLNPSFKRTFEFGNTEYVAQEFKRGRSFSLGINYLIQ